MGMEDLLRLLATPLLWVILLVTVILVIRRRRAEHENARGSVAPAGPGDAAAPEMAIPVQRLWNTAGFLGEHSNLSPKLWIAADRLRFKVLWKTREMRFANLHEVHVDRPLVAAGVRIFFRCPHWSGLPLPSYGLIADVPDIATARTVLRALPPEVPLSEAAAGLRDP
ncbi:hypothetical protein [Roseomonas sp. WA12]